VLGVKRDGAKSTIRRGSGREPGQAGKKEKSLKKDRQNGQGATGPIGKNGGQIMAG